jgi:hypothetical protein
MVRSTPPRVIALDTNILSLLLSYYSLVAHGASSVERERRLRQVRGRSEPVSGAQFDALWQFFKTVPRRIVTQHVVAEAFGNKMRKQFNWSDAIGLLPKYHVEELGCCISDLYADKDFRPIIEALGPTDAGLIHTAEVEKAAILSEDGPLRNWAQGRRVETLAWNQMDRL